MPIGGLLGILFLFEMFLVVDNDLIPLLSNSQITNVHNIAQIYVLDFTDWSAILETVTNINAIGQLVYTYYFYFFLIVSLILLVAMIGAIVLTMHKGVNVKRQEFFEQNTREFAKTITKLS